MSHDRSHGPLATNPWPLVLCLIGVDYFSTLAYLPSIAVAAAGPLAPVAAAGVVLVTFVMALPIYWYVVGRSPDGRGATGIFEDRVPGWRGKLAALTGGFFLAMTALTMLVNHSGLTIALAFVAGILVSSFVSRWIRSTELRFEGFDFADRWTQQRWLELCRSGAKALAPHRPGLLSSADAGQGRRRGAARSRGAGVAARGARRARSPGLRD
jgi:hypothetical protein